MQFEWHLKYFEFWIIIILQDSIEEQKDAHEIIDA